jgi:hypothetical protein
MMIRILSICFLLATLGTARAQTFENPGTYFDFFNREHAAIAQKNMEYLQYAVHSEDLGTIVQKRMGLLEQLQSTQKKLAELPPYAGDAGLRAEMQAVLATYLNLFNLGFQEIEALKSDAAESYEKMARYLQAQTAAEQQMAQASARFLTAQRQFARTHDIELLEGEPTSEAEQLNNLNTYQRNLFLRAFRLGTLNARFLAALDQNEPTTLQQARQELASAAQKELEAVRLVGDFNGNTNYRDAVITQVALYLSLASNEYVTVCQVAAKGSQLTPEDVASYNAAVQATNTRLNPAVEKVNQTLQELLRTNVPKPALKGVKQI